MGNLVTEAVSFAKESPIGHKVQSYKTIRALIIFKNVPFEAFFFSIGLFRTINTNLILH